MKVLVLLLTFFTALVACAQDTQQAIETFRQDATVKIKTLASSLKQELGAAMQSGGPVAAVEICQLKAPQITHDLNASDDISIKRTSLKLRNPNNIPDAWERQVLESFEDKLAKGTPASELSHMESFKSESGTTLRMMRAIPVQGLCLACHGDENNMDPVLLGRLEKLYPNDLATGYQTGEIRGAFSVSRTIEN